MSQSAAQSQASEPNQCFAKIETKVEPRSQQLVAVVCPDFEAVFSQQLFLFEPLKPFSDGCLVARSLHTHANN